MKVSKDYKEEYDINKIILGVLFYFQLSIVICISYRIFYIHVYSHYPDCFSLNYLKITRHAQSLNLLPVISFSHSIIEFKGNMDISIKHYGKKTQRTHFAKISVLICFVT